MPVLAARSVRTVAALRPVEPFLGALFAAGLTADEALAAVDVVAQYILGGVVGYYHHLVDDEVGQQREFDALDVTEFPHMSRVLAEGHYVGFDAEFEFGLDAIVRGLLDRPHTSLRERQ